MNYIKPWRLGLALLTFCLLTAVGHSDESKTTSNWIELKKPSNSKGLFMEPKLMSMGSRVHMVWSGTNSEVKKPEVFHTSISGNSTEWKNARPPFFGRSKARVRKVAIGRTRNLIGILFQRSTRQGNDAYEVLLSISSDQGWSWSNTIVIDSFVAEKNGGTTVSIAGRQGSNRPEFAMAWTAAFGSVRAANFDINSSLRPEGVVVGQTTASSRKVETGAFGRSGFGVVFNNGSGIASAHIKALIGKIEEGKTFLRGRFGEFLTVSSGPFGPSRVAVGTGKNLDTMTSKGTKWKKDDSSTELPFSTHDVAVESDLDEKKNLHLAMLRPNQGKQELWYIGQTKKKWGQPELVHVFDSKVDVKGFDIAATKKFVYLVGSEGFHAKFFRKSL